MRATVFFADGKEQKRYDELRLRLLGAVPLSRPEWEEYDHLVNSGIAHPASNLPRVATSVEMLPTGKEILASATAQARLPADADPFSEDRDFSQYTAADEVDALRSRLSRIEAELGRAKADNAALSSQLEATRARLRAVKQALEAP